MRSHSPDIADDINREIAETGMRLANLAANSSHADNTMTIESNHSMREGDDSQRSGSSDGSLNKRRTMKSNIALKNKQIQMKKQESKYNLLTIFRFRKGGE